MAAITERGIHRGFSRLRLEDIEDFSEADGPVRACGSLAAGDYLLDIVRETFGLVFLIFLGKAPRMRSAVADASFVGR